MSEWQTIKQYESNKNVTKVAKTHSSRGMIVTRFYLEKENNGKYTISYIYEPSAWIKYPARLAYFLAKPLVPFVTFLYKFIQQDRPYYKGYEYKENRDAYKKYYYENDLLRPLNTGQMYSNQEYIPNWVDATDFEQSFKYVKGFSMYSSMPRYKKEKAAQEYLGHSLGGSMGSSVMIIQSMLAGISVPQEIIDKEKAQYDYYHKDKG